MSDSLPENPVEIIRLALGEYMDDEIPARVVHEWFDRWLAEHDAQVLRDAAGELHREYPNLLREAVRRLRARADDIAAGWLS